MKPLTPPRISTLPQRSPRAASEGAHVVCLDRPADDELLASVAREIGGTPLLVDVSDPEAASKIAERTTGELMGARLRHWRTPAARGSSSDSGREQRSEM